MICEKCGKEYDESLNACPNCSLVSEEVAPESQTLGICAIVFSAMCGTWIGLILAIIGLAKYKQPEGKKKCYIAIAIIVAWIVIGFIIGFIGGLISELSFFISFTSLK